MSGNDCDNAIMDWIISKFRTETAIDLSRQSDALQRIKKEAEKTEIALSSSQEYEIDLPYLTADATWPKHIQKQLTRTKREELTDDLFERNVQLVKECLSDAKLTECDTNDLVLVGGMTRMPKVIETARKLIGKAANSFAVGAAIQGGDLTPCAIYESASESIHRPWIRARLAPEARGG